MFSVTKYAKKSEQRQMQSPWDVSSSLADLTVISMGQDAEAAPLNVCLAAANPVQALVQGSIKLSKGVPKADAGFADLSGLESRWSALKSLYEPANQYKSRFGCQQHYVAWWRGEGVA